MAKRLLTIVMAITLCTSMCLAGRRSPGKYSGVVIFDRWGGCMLYSGVYVMYISESVKGRLRAEAGKCIQINATEVEQRLNPGDGLIKKMTVLGPAPEVKPWESPKGLKLAVASVVDEGSGPQFVIRVENVSDKSKTLYMDTLAATLLAEKPSGDVGWAPSDGPSFALITRQAFWIGEEARMRGQGITNTMPWQWKVLAPKKLEREIMLEPKAAFELRLSFKVPPGEYEFLAGYGGGVHEGQCIASNLIAFDVKKDGTAVIVNTVGR